MRARAQVFVEAAWLRWWARVGVVAVVGLFEVRGCEQIGFSVEMGACDAATMFISDGDVSQHQYVNSVVIMLFTY